VAPAGLSQSRQAMRHEAATSLADGEYRAIINAIFVHVEATIDRWLQDDLIDIDTHRTGGLLELRFLDGSKIVINAQPPLRELWMASRRGGYHYRHADGRWIDREGKEFFEALSSCASEQAGLPLRFAPQG
jgi:CyaY protein